MALTSTVKIAIPFSISISALYPALPADCLGDLNKHGKYRFGALPTEVADAIIAESVSRYATKESAKTVVSSGAGLPSDVEELLSIYGLESAFQATLSEILRQYSSINELVFETLDDPDSEERWVVIGIRSGLEHSVKRSAYDAFIANWIEMVDDSKRPYIRIEHLNS